MPKVLITKTNEIVDASFAKGGVYLFFKVEAPRSINPKAKRKADELLIVGIPKNAFLKGLQERKYKLIDKEE